MTVPNDQWPLSLCLCCEWNEGGEGREGMDALVRPFHCLSCAFGHSPLLSLPPSMPAGASQTSLLRQTPPIRVPSSARQMGPGWRAAVSKMSTRKDWVTRKGEERRPPRIMKKTRNWADWHGSQTSQCADRCPPLWHVNILGFGWHK